MLTRAKKEQQIQELARIIDESGTVIFTDFGRLSMPEVRELRRELRDNNIHYKASKKSLWPFVQKQADFPAEAIDFTTHPGSVGIAYGPGEGVEASKVLTKFAKTHEHFSILGGIVNKEHIALSSIKALASLPSREELLARLAYVIASPVRNFMQVLAAPQRDFVSVLAKISEKK